MSRVTTTLHFPYTASALKVEQPLGTYFVAILPAEVLLEVCFSDRLKAHKENGGTYVLEPVYDLEAEYAWRLHAVVCGCSLRAVIKEDGAKKVLSERYQPGAV